jgi:hypothetical protein
MNRLSRFHLSDQKLEIDQFPLVDGPFSGYKTGAGVENSPIHPARGSRPTRGFGAIHVLQSLPVVVSGATTKLTDPEEEPGEQSGTDFDGSPRAPR